MRAAFPDEESLSPLEPALAMLPTMGTWLSDILFEPSQFVDDLARYPAWCAEVVERVAALDLPRGSAALGPAGR